MEFLTPLPDTDDRDVKEQIVGEGLASSRILRLLNIWNALLLLCYNSYPMKII